MAKRHYSDRADSASPKFTSPICCCLAGRFVANRDPVKTSAPRGLVPDGATLSASPIIC